MSWKQLIYLFFLVGIPHLFFAQHTITIKKAPKIEGLYQNTLKKTTLPSYFYFTKEGKVYYTFSKKIKPKRAMVKLTLCAMEKSCNDFPKADYTYSENHIRFIISERADRGYFIIYDGQLSNNNQELSIRKEETNQLITVNQYVLVEPKK